MSVLLISLAFIIAKYVFFNEDKAASYAVRRNNLELTDSERKALELHFPFYNGLSPDNQLEFRKRLAYFLSSKRFIAHDGLDLFGAMKALICAELIRMTFGLKKFVLPHFKLIRVYPQEYYSRLTQGYHKGEVDLRGSIVLAWTSFQEGILDRQDGLNVAIHEFAHAIYFENFIKNKHYLFINPDLLAEWNRLAEIEMKIMKLDQNHFIRAYGSTNSSEFFAVSTEHFFEQPEDFKKEHLELFELMMKIYNQNPLTSFKTRS